MERLCQCGGVLGLAASSPRERRCEAEETLVELACPSVEIPGKEGENNMRALCMVAVVVTGIVPSLAQANSLDYTIVALPGVPTGSMPAAINNNG